MVRRSTLTDELDRLACRAPGPAPDTGRGAGRVAAGTGCRRPGHDAGLDLAAALQRLAPRQRTVVVPCSVDDLTERETPVALGIAVGAVTSLHRDTPARLRQDLLALRIDEGPRDGTQERATRTVRQVVVASFSRIGPHRTLTSRRSPG